MKAETLPSLLAALHVDDEVLGEAACFDPPDHWLGHVPFMFWLMRRLRPALLVEISAESRVSHFASCQAIDAQSLSTQAYAIGGWAAAPPDHPWVQDHDNRYGRFSRVSGDIGQAWTAMAEQRIDLLILRGTASLEIDATFDRWRKLLSSRAVLLVDQIDPLQGAAGAFWTKLAGAHPHFVFPHALGLGVAAIGSEMPPSLEALFALSEPDAGAPVRRFFAARGKVGELRGALEAERRQARLGAANHQAQIGAIQTRYRSRLTEAHRNLSAWLGQSLQQYDQWMRAEIHRSRVDAASTVDQVGRERAQVVDRLSQVSQQLSQVAGERDQARLQIGQLVQSTSWRATRPLRWLRGQGDPAPGDGPASQSLPSGAEAKPGPVVEPPSPPSPPPAPALPRDPAFDMPDLFELREHRATSRIAVVLHVRHPETIEASLSGLDGLSEPFDLFVLLVEERATHLRPSIRHRFPAAHVFDFPDHGDDILAFLTIAGTGALFAYELVCKLQARLLEDEATAFPGDRAQAAASIAAFTGNPDLGLVVADESAVSVAEHWSVWQSQLAPWRPLLGLSPDRPPPDDLISGRVFWIRPWVLRDIVSLQLDPDDFSAGSAMVEAVASLFGVVCHSAGMIVTTASAARNASAPPMPARTPPVIAFYLPQYHPTPENDRWWGAGFTEWTNVTRAKKRLAAQRQPRLPGELGFVDLRLAESREAQAELAQTYGLTAFCYYYYWFGRGQRLLNRPLDEVCATGKPDFPFLICWANEPWSRRWDGTAEDVLMGQDYGPGWEAAFADDAAPVMQDSRYLRARDGRKLLLIYRIMHLPHPAESLSRLRRHLLDLGVGPVHIACGRFSLVGDDPLPDDPADAGCDTYFEFPPHGLPVVASTDVALSPGSPGQVFDYPATIDRAIERLHSDPEDTRIHHGVMAGWDNTARRGEAAHVFGGATPAHFRRWLRSVIRQEQARTDGADKLVFVNAWNEWAEGTYLEPDRDFGRGWLEAVRSALGEPPRHPPA